MASVTVSDINELAQQILERRREKDEIEERLTEKNKEISSLEQKASAYLADLGLDKYVSPVGSLAVGDDIRVNLPVGDENKEAFFNHLRERGLFEHYATVNSNSLQAYYKSERRAAEERGEDMMTWTLPGIGAPKIERKFKFTKAR